MKSNDDHRQPSPRTVADGVNLERAALRVESMQTYAIVSSIIMGSSIGILSLNASLTFGEEGTSYVEKAAEYILLSLQAISLVASSYTTVIFTLMALYYSTALGLGGDECYQSFDKATSTLRMRAFYSFVTAIVSLMLSFLPCAYLFVHGIKGVIMTSLIAVLISLSFYDFKSVIDSAGRTIFNPLFQPDSKLCKRASRRRLTGGHYTAPSEPLMKEEKVLPRLAQIKAKLDAKPVAKEKTKHRRRSLSFDNALHDVHEVV